MTKSLTLIVLSLLLLGTVSAQWIEVNAPPANFRSDHTFGFALDDVGYLVTGNVDFETTADFYSYLPDTDEWTQLPDFPGGTRGYGIGDIWDGKAYFGFGGTDDNGSSFQFKRDLWVFDPATQEWTELSSCPCSPRLHPAFVANNGSIFVGLGNDNGGNRDDWWEYNIETDTWTQKTDFPSHPRHHPYQFAIGDYVYAGFGHGSVFPDIYDTWYRYDNSDDSWMQVSSIPGEGRVAGTQFSHDGFGYVLSGQGEDHQFMGQGEFWKYDADNDTWEALEPHPGESRWAPASFVLNDEVYLFNGSITSSNYPDEAYKFNLGEIAIGIEEGASFDSDFQIFPNPFSDNLQLRVSSEFSNSDIGLVVYNLLGESVYRSSGVLSNSELHLEFLNEGVYLVEIYSAGLLVDTKKIVKN